MNKYGVRLHSQSYLGYERLPAHHSQQDLQHLAPPIKVFRAEFNLLFICWTSFIALVMLVNHQTQDEHMVIGYTVSRTLERRSYQHITPNKIINILFPIKVFRAGFNLLVDLHSDWCISSIMKHKMNTW